MAEVVIIVGSKSDIERVQPCMDMLSNFGVSHDLKVYSAHRTPDALKKYIRKAESNGVKVFITAAGLAAALPGTVAAHTLKPVLGIPLDAGTLGGIDAVMAILQMPGGVPVATMGAIGEHGARNAALFAVQILSQQDSTYEHELAKYRKKMAERVLESYWEAM